ncbi:MAG: amidase [Pseudohongiellaceae bacterium]|jgi:amidase
MADLIHYASLSQVAKLIQTGELGPVELTELMLTRIADVDKTLQSYATVTADKAMLAAKKAEEQIAEGDYKGPLHGIPVAVKDLCFTKDVKTMGGLKVRKNFVPNFDATVVEKLEAAGAVVLGKLNLTEGALSGYNRGFDIPINPWGENLWAGVSSSGSGVATAAGLCFASLGTDTGGSIRYPAMANGIVGLKPTYGRVSRFGVMALASSLDHVGPMTRTVQDAAVVFEAIAGFDHRDGTSLRAPVPNILDSLSLDAGLDLRGIKIGVDERYICEGTNPDLVLAITKVIETLKQLGAQLVSVSMPEDGPKELRAAWLPVTAYEALQAHADTYPARAADYGGYLGDVLALGLNMTEADYNAAMNLRAEISNRFELQLSEVDAVICPSGGSVFEVEKELQYGDMETLKPVIQKFQGQFTIPADLAGTPSITVPCGFSAANTPYAVQFLGSRLAELNLCRIAYAYEQSSNWHLRHPSF